MSIGVGKYISTYSNSQSTKQVNTSYERLSSGLRINKASDDVAGVAVAESLSSKSRVYNRGIRNLEDGSSLLAIADSAISELSNITARITELAEQAANGVLNSNQRSSLDKEAQALSKEYSRIIQTTKFNGQKVLSSEIGALKLQGGEGEAGAIQSTLGGKVGNGSYSAESSIATGVNPWTVETGDFNNDGVTDLMTGNLGGDDISVILGNGDGSFRSAVSYALDANINPRAATTADFNGDGNLDIASANNAGDNVSILMGRGDGTFAGHVNYAAGDGSRWVEAADYNNDGFADIATVNEFDGTMSILLGRGDGTFNAKVDYANSVGSRTATAGDLNGDGNLDIVTTSEGASNISVYLGRGDGTFQNQVTYATGGTARNAVIEDFDGNGTMDVAVTNSTTLGGLGPGNIAIFSGSGNGTLSLASTLSVAATGDSRGLFSADINGDGTKDLVATREVDDSVIFFANDGSANFTAGAITLGTGDAPIAIAAGDFNADGVFDLATSNATGNSVSILIGSYTSGTSTLLDFSLKTLSDAKQALPILNRKINDLATQRGQIGAFQSRLNYATNNLHSQSLNFSAAASLIRDADIAEESAQLIKYSIKQKGELAIQAQANQNAGVVLALLS